MNKKIALFAGIFFGLLALSGIGFLVYKFFLGGSGTIVVWTLKGNEGAVADVGEIFHKKYPKYKVRIVPVPEQIYEYRALFALASQGGSQDYPAPDVWIMPNEWLSLHANKLVAAPDKALDKGISAYRTKKGKDATGKYPRKGRNNLEVITQDYAPIAKNDLIREGGVYGVPINMDTLAVFYDKSKINTPPKTWSDVVEYTKRFTIKSGDTVTRSTVALGDNQSVSHFVDILSILMLQNGTDMVDTQNSTATFNISQTGATPAGTRALDFYTSFARPGKDTYTWNKDNGESLRALKDGKTLMAFGYLNDLEKVGPVGQTKIAVAPLPQVDPNHPETYGRYLAATVTKYAQANKRSDVAWDFAALFANPDAIEQYATTMRQVPARKDVAARLTLGPQYKAYQDQVGNATNWQKAEVRVADGAMDEALRLVLDKKEDVQVSLDVASKAYTSFLKRTTGIESDPDILSLWQSEEDTTDYKELIRGFVDDAKLKRVAVSKHLPERYEWEILNAMAAYLGPDLLFVPNDTVTRLAPTLRAYPKNSFNPSPENISDLLALERVYAPAVTTDNVVDGKIYGMPINFETLMLAVNRDLMQERRVELSRNEDELFDKYERVFSNGPVTWEELKIAAQIGAEHNGDTVTRPLVALGTGSNVAHSDDLFGVLVKQFGGEVTDPDRLVTGIHLPESSRDGSVAGEKAVQLLQSFSTPSSPSYTWNATLPNSLEAMATNKVIMAFVYPRDLPYLKSINPTLRLDLYPLPQLDIASDPIDMASYYTAVIPKSSKRPNDSLTFVRNAVLDPSLNEYNVPTRERQETSTLERRGDPQTIQKNTAQSYYKGRYPDEVDQGFIDLLDKRFSLVQIANRMNVSLKKKVL